MTNADRIREMSNAELAGFLAEVKKDKFGYIQFYSWDEHGWIDWLRKEVDE